MIKTIKFGNVEVADDRILFFERGLLGFPRLTKYVLIATNGDKTVFFSLQSIEVPDVSFVVMDPRMFFPDYPIPAR